eukprot:6230040-Karenia_brevis.AAC.1
MAGASALEEEADAEDVGGDAICCRKRFGQGLGEEPCVGSSRVTLGQQQGRELEEAKQEAVPPVQLQEQDLP